MKEAADGRTPVAHTHRSLYRCHVSGLGVQDGGVGMSSMPLLLGSTDIWLASCYSFRSAMEVNELQPDARELHTSNGLSSASAVKLPHSDACSN